MCREQFIDELAEMGCYGLSIPQQYGGFEDDGQADHLMMVIASDETITGIIWDSRKPDHPPRAAVKSLGQRGNRGSKTDATYHASPQGKFKRRLPLPSRMLGQT